MFIYKISYLSKENLDVEIQCFIQNLYRLYSLEIIPKKEPMRFNRNK